jgi:hypothetical protein
MANDLSNRFKRSLKIKHTTRPFRREAWHHANTPKERVPPDEAGSSTVHARAGSGRTERSTPVTATLRLTRHANGMVIELRRGQFEIELKPDWAIALTRQ